MKSLRKKSIILVLILTMMIAIFIPSIVNAGSIGTVGSGARVTFNETATDSDEVASSTDIEEYINSKKDAFIEALTDRNISVNLSNSNIDPNTLFSASEPYKYVTVANIDQSYAMIEGTLTQTFTVSYTSYTVTKEESKITRKTTTVYHTKVQGTLNINGDNTYTKNYISGDEYLDGNYSDAEIATIISNYKQDMQTTAANYSATINNISQGITDYYYDVHDEITQTGVGGSNVILVGDVNDLDSAYTSQGSITINTIMDKYQTYTINATATRNSTTVTKITGANITLTAPKVGDKVEKITKNDGYGDYNAQSIQPTVTTTTEGLNVYAFWAKGLEDLSQESFYGTFEKDTYYYAMIDFEAEEGYELTSTFPDGIKVNGVTPDEVFAVYGGIYNHCIAKIKATAEEVAEPQQKEYIVNSSTNSGDSISFTALEGDTYSFYIKDRKDTTDEELQEIVNLMNNPEYTFKTLKEQLNKLIAYGKNAAGDKGDLLKLYEMYLYNNGLEIHEVAGGFKIKLKITDDMKGYDSYKIFYIAEDGTTEKAIDLTKNGEYLEGTLLHLSMYALVGNKNEITTTEDTATTTEGTATTRETTATEDTIRTRETTTANNPKTGDYILTIFSIFAIATLGTFTTINLSRNRKTRNH